MMLSFHNSHAKVPAKRQSGKQEAKGKSFGQVTFLILEKKFQMKLFKTDSSRTLVT